MIVCAQCGQTNLENARFCNSCGATLAVQPGAEVRKTVTVLFCDLVGSTSMGDQSDPELLREAMARYHAELRTILERHGGTVEKFIGDAAMAVFGIPQVHEDDALRAVRAAAEIGEAVARLGLEVRIGINTGEVVAGAGETLVTGDAVNIAARLEQAASSGQILLGETTEHIVRDAARTEPVDPLELKGKAERVAAFRLVELLPDMPTFTQPTDSPFVGREQELETLEHALDTTAEQRQPQLVTIAGPPGIGKSRLVRELVRRSDARVLVGRCLSYGEGITYWPLQEVVSQLGDVRSAMGSDPDAELAASRIAAALGTAESTSSEEIAWGFRKLFEALAREKALIVVLDDIHWAEPTLLDLIEYVSTFAQDAPLLLLCTARPDLFEERPAWATPKPNVTLIALEPLASSQTETLVEELRAVPEQAKVRIVEAAEGNPLFVEQLVAIQAETGNGKLDIPPTIQALLAARIDRLQPDERAVVERASIEGRLFHRGSVQELVPGPVRAGVGGHLLTLVRKEFIRPDRATVAGDDGFRFGHILIRDAAYDAMPKRLRAELHERFAGWLESKLGDEAPDEILGYHLEQAYRYRVELGQDDEHTRELGLRAGRLLSEAGLRAHSRLDITATCSLLSRATNLLPQDDPARPALLTLLGHSTFEIGEGQRALEILHVAQDAAAAFGQRNIELRARMRELGCLALRVSSEAMTEALSEARAAIPELEELDDPRSLLDAWWLVAQAGLSLNDMSLREEAALHSLELARQQGLRREAAEAARSLGFALANGPTPVSEAIPRVEQAFADSPEEPAVALALLYAFAGRHNEAEQVVTRARRAQLELGKRLQHAADSMDLGWIALLSGRPEWAEPELQAGAKVLEAAGERGWLSTVATVLAEVLYRLGRDEEAEEWTHRSERAMPHHNEDFMWLSTRAKVLARRGEAEHALRLSGMAVEQARAMGDRESPHWTGDCLFYRAEVLRLLERPDEARPVLKEALAVYERKGVVPSIERTQEALAELPA